MNSDAKNRAQFDRWAESYDRTVPGSAQFPLAGYDEVLGRVLEHARVTAGMSILDMGTGTGNLAALFSAASCSVWATDLSSAMLMRAREKHPCIHFAVADLEQGPPEGFPLVYDRIVSAYAFHHLPLPTKVRCIRDLALHHLSPNGSLVLADVAFPTASARASAHARLHEIWDASEFYWAADEAEVALRGVPARVLYRQVSFCGGVFVIEPIGLSDDSG